MKTIYKDTHRAFPPSIGLFRNAKSIKKKITFDSSCRYDLTGEDQYDINKLFGLGYFWHHEESARFGWRYNRERDVIDIFAYCYVNKQRIMRHITWVPLNVEITYTLEIDMLLKMYRFIIGPSLVKVPFMHSRKWAYKLGVYFGGNNVAPHTMKIKMQ